MEGRSVTLRAETAEFFATTTIQPQSFLPDERGSAYGSKWTNDGDPIPAAWVDMDAREAFESGLEKRKRAVKLFVDAIVDGADKRSPVTGDQRVILEGRAYNVIHPKVVYSEDSVVIKCESV